MCHISHGRHNITTFEWGSRWVFSLFRIFWTLWDSYYRLAVFVSKFFAQSSWYFKRCHQINIWWGFLAKEVHAGPSEFRINLPPLELNVYRYKIINTKLPTSNNSPITMIKQNGPAVIGNTNVFAMSFIDIKATVND